jgi:hypothetical protein
VDTPKTTLGYWIREDIFDRPFDVQIGWHITTGLRKVYKYLSSGMLKLVFLQQWRTFLECLEFQCQAVLMANQVEVVEPHLLQYLHEALCLFFTQGANCALVFEVQKYFSKESTYFFFILIEGDDVAIVSNH